MKQEINEHVDSLNRIIHQIEVLVKQKKSSALSNDDKDDLDFLSNQLKRKLSNLMSLYGLENISKYIKVSNLNVSSELIFNILADSNLQCSRKRDEIIVPFKIEEIFCNPFIVKFRVENNWIKCYVFAERSSIADVSILQIQKIINEYNYSTRFFKAVLDEDHDILLIRNDYISYFWDEEDLKDLLLTCISLSQDFFKKYRTEIEASLNEPINEE